MTQTTDSRTESAGAADANGPRHTATGPSFVYDPWARPTDAAAAGAAQSSQPANPYAPVPPAFGAGSPPPPGVQHHASQPGSRRPGWLALGGATLTAALLASLLTAGAIKTFDPATQPVGSSSSSAAPSAAARGPVTSSTAANPDWEAVSASASQSVVAIQVSSGQSGAEGSGVVLDTQGHVLTNNHVVAAGQTITVVFSDGRGYSAKVVGTDPSTDLAVIKIENPPSGLKPITLGDSGAVKVGDPVMAVGNPLGLSNTVTTGIVSAVNRPVTTQAEESTPDQSQQADPTDPFGLGQGQDQQGQGSSAGSGSDPVVTNAIQTDAAVNPGNSGGALVDVQGRLIGITSSIASMGTSSGGQAGSIGIGFAIPVNLAKNIADQIIATGKASHAWLGVQLGDKGVTLDGAQYQAAVVGQVLAGSPAESAKLQADDAIIAIDGEAVNGAESLTAQIRERKPGTEVTLTVVRDGKKVDVAVTLGTRSEN